MKKNLGILLLWVAVMTACEKGDPGPVINGTDKKPFASEGVFILNEGNFMHGNGSVSFYSIDSGKIYNAVFEAANGRGPGDVPFSMTVAGDTGYLVVNNSGKIEMIDVGSMTSLKTLSGLNSPRYVCLLKGSKAYVSSLYSDEITIIDRHSLTVKGTIKTGLSSEMMVQAGNRVYAASWTENKRVAVIDAVNDKFLSSIETGMEPESMVLDKKGRLWVLCSGGYLGQEKASLQIIDTSDNTVKKKLYFPDHSYPSSLTVNAGRDTLYYIDNGVYRMGIDEQTLPATPLIAAGGRLLYRIEACTANGELFVTDARDYQRNGYLLRYSAGGNLLDNREAGIIPGRMVYVKNDR